MKNTWQKRETTILTCPSGNQVRVRRTGPDLAVKAGKYTRVLQKVAGKRGHATPEEQLAAIEKLSDKELEQLMAFARVLIADVVVEPTLVLNPKEGQLGPDDVPLNDFWFIHTWATNGGPTMPVKTREGETTVDAVETFPRTEGSGLTTGPDSESIQ